MSQDQQRKFTAVVSKPTMIEANNGAVMHVVIRNAPQFGQVPIKILLRPDATEADAERLAQVLNDLGLEITMP
jgi:hypothetical protein